MCLQAAQRLPRAQLHSLVAQGSCFALCNCSLTLCLSCYFSTAAPVDVTGSIMTDVGNRAPAARFTPSKTGLTGKALRVPSRFARTPGVAAATAGQDAGTAAGTAAAPKATLTSVLKRLTFSAAKPGLVGGGGQGDSSGTPAVKQRHVSFGAGTVSPATRPAARRQSHVQFQTPQPTIDENEAESPAPSQVNSVNAGRTPYDARLSGLLRKYSLLDTPAVSTDAEEEDGQEEEGEWSGAAHALVAWLWYNLCRYVMWAKEMYNSVLQTSIVE